MEADGKMWRDATEKDLAAALPVWVMRRVVLVEPDYEAGRYAAKPFVLSVEDVKAVVDAAYQPKDDV